MSNGQRRYENKMTNLTDQNIIYLLTDTEAGFSLKEFLTRKGISRHFLIKLRNNDKVTVDGHIQKYWLPLKAGQKIVLNPYLDEPANIEPVEMPLEIIYEDHDYIAINKPFNVATHPCSAHLTNTIANGVQYYLNSKGYQSLHPVNRLDKTTSGVVVFGKHPLAQHHIFQQTIQKEYVALVEGHVKENELLLNYPIKKIDGPSIRRIVAQDGKEAQTKYTLISTGDDRSLLRVELFTGRTHQIRVHLAHIGHPITGDFLYGTENTPRLFLHSFRYSVLSLRDNHKVEIEAPIPKSFYDYLY